MPFLATSDASATSAPTTSNHQPTSPALVLQVAHVAHLGGALAGVALAVALTKLPR